MPDANDGENAEGPPRAETAGSVLARVRAERGSEDPELRERIMVAALSTSGELGYRGMNVQAVIERYGGYRMQFYTYYASASECYGVAHATHIERLERRLLDAGAAAPSWRVGLRAALRQLAAFAESQPPLARGLLLEVHTAGPPARDRREEVLERLSRALDSARRETESRHSPPPLTAPFMVGAIEAAVVRALAKGQPSHFAAAIPELEQMISLAYFGRGAPP